jgi:hypothetical protein
MIKTEQIPLLYKVKEVRTYPDPNPEYKPLRLFEPLRIRLNATKKFIAYDQIYSYFEPSEAIYMRKNLLKLPEYFLEVCFEFGVEIISIIRAEAYEKVISYRKKRIRIRPEYFNDVYPAGCYEPGARLVTVYNKLLKDKDYNYLAFFMARAFQHAILSNENIIKIPEYYISYENRFLPYYVIRYALKKDTLYFAYSVEKFLSDNRWKELKDNDRPMFRFLEMLFGKHPSTVREEELTGMEYAF